MQRQDRLGAPIAPLLRGAAGGVTLDQEQLGQRRVFLLAVGELARQAGDVEGALAARHLARLACGLAGTRRVDDFRDDRLGFLRALQQEFFELFGHGLFDDALDFR